MRQKYFRVIFWILLLTLPFQSAGFIDCTGLAEFESDDNGSDTGDSGSGAGLLYVLDNSNDAVYVFEDIENLSGDQDPVRTLSGDDTLIEDPKAIAIDPAGDILYVLDASEDAVLVFTQASELDGNEIVTKTLPIDGNPQSMTYDRDNDRLYVSDVANESILIWEDVRSIADGTFSNRSFDIGFIASDILIDELNQVLYIGDPDFKAVQVYEQPEQKSGEINPDRSIIKFIVNEDDPDDIEEFESIKTLAVDALDNILFVVDAQTERMDVFENASFLDGELEPDRQVLGGSTRITDDLKKLLFLDDKLYGAISDDEIAIWEDADTLEGNTAPTRVVKVNSATRIIDFDVDL